MKKIINIYNWINYQLSYWTHNNKPEYQFKLWEKWQDGLRKVENKKVNYTHTLKQNEL